MSSRRLSMARPGFIPTVESKMMYEEYNPDAVVEKRAFFTMIDQYAGLGGSCSNPPFRYSAPSAMATEAYRKNISVFFRSPPALYTHRNYQFASIIFNVMKHNVEQYSSRPSRNLKQSHHPWRKKVEPSGPSIIQQAAIASAASAAVKLKTNDATSVDESLPLIDFSSEKEKRLSFSLVFETLKCRPTFIKVIIRITSYDLMLHLNYLITVYLK